MTRTHLLLLAAATAALCTGGASALAAKSGLHSGSYRGFQDAKVLYAQNSNDAGTGINSQNFTSGSDFLDDQGADDFIVPKGQVWTIREVDVTGVFFSGYGPAKSENVFFYKNKDSEPGDPVANGTFTNPPGSADPNFSLALPGKGLKLKPGKYWVSVVANIDWGAGGAWAWEISSVQHNNQAMWQNPYNGYCTGCKTWGTLENCLQQSGDFMFALRGRIKQN